MRFSFKFLFLQLTVSWKKEFPVLGLIWASWIVHWDICELSIFDYYNVSRLFVPNLLVWEDLVKFLIFAIKSSNRSIYILRCFRCSFSILATWSSWGIIIWFLAMLVLDSTIYLSTSRSFAALCKVLLSFTSYIKVTIKVSVLTFLRKIKNLVVCFSNIIIPFCVNKWFYQSGHFYYLHTSI